MKKRQLIATILAVIAIFVQTGALAACAEQGPIENLPLTQTLPSAVTEDGHVDSEILKQWVDAYLQENHWDSPGCMMEIAFWYPGTDEYWFYNADEWMYGVNWYKLPVSMFFSEKLAEGELTPETVVTGITLEYALTTVLEYSSGPSIYSLMTYLDEVMGVNYLDLAKQYADLPESYYADSYYSNNGYTARLMMEITKTLFSSGEERFPYVLESMKKSQPEDLFKRDWLVRTTWDVAQQHAAYWSDQDDFIHCTGIFYTPTPVILTIMSKNIWDLDIIGGIAGHFANLGVELDLKQHQLNDNSPLPSPETDNNGQNTVPLSTVTDVSSISGANPETSTTSATEDTDSSAAPNENLPVSESPSSDGTSSVAEMKSSDASQAPDQASSAVSERNAVPLLIVLFFILLILIIVKVLLVLRKKNRE